MLHIKETPLQLLVLGDTDGQRSIFGIFYLKRETIVMTQPEPSTVDRPLVTLQ